MGISQRSCEIAGLTYLDNQDFIDYDAKFGSDLNKRGYPGNGGYFLFVKKTVILLSKTTIL
ncbi:hypothetical protein [Methanolobus psychrotolerans]|uniref:hypothetical protein n=1 Tax=Methanolobus psychrotolerans TaxID=1874706 RepID=UPI00101AE3AA|nr:hypothetical protein [Methanolobus psychrotolerans]